MLHGYRTRSECCHCARDNATKGERQTTASVINQPFHRAVLMPLPGRMWQQRQTELPTPISCQILRNSFVCIHVYQHKPACPLHFGSIREEILYDIWPYIDSAVRFGEPMFLWGARPSDGFMGPLMGFAECGVKSTTATKTAGSKIEGERPGKGGERDTEWSSDTPLPSQHSHAALTQRVPVNLAWRKHGFTLNAGSDIHWDGSTAPQARVTSHRYGNNRETTCH